MATFLRRSLMKIFLILFLVTFLASCGAGQGPLEETVDATPTTAVDLPKITSVEVDRDEVSRYESMEFTVEVDAKFSNPYDLRKVSLDAVFASTTGDTMRVPGFWDGDGAWKIRFTPSTDGKWTYEVSVKDTRGRSLPSKGEFTVTSSQLHGWIIPGNTFDPAYSGHYLVYHDGTPFFGVGHADALNILIDGFDATEGVRLFDVMKEANENYVVWWPLYTNSPVNSSYDDYSVANMKVIDAIVRDAEKEGVHLIFTIWDHPQLRDDKHPTWDTGNWSRNGFSKLGDLIDFFVSDESWAWQQNLYRYIIARWGYSPAIGMWLTVSEINGTNALDQTDPWHEKVNAYFVDNDPYRHPTTASKSGEEDWAEGHLLMDAPQVHLYDFKEGPVSAAKNVSDWTSLMWERAEKPNWIGEFGVTESIQYPELFHYSIWAALSSGASMTPAEWNSGGPWGRMTPEMNADISRLAEFVKEMPLARWDPSRLKIASNDPEIRAWGITGNDGGLFWVQDFSLEGKPIEDVRASMTLRTGVLLQVNGMAGGSYLIEPYDTWQGVYLPAIEITCMDGEPCLIALPDFMSDIAVRITRK